jgi:hypothetical protein
MAEYNSRDADAHGRIQKMNGTWHTYLEFIANYVSRYKNIL